MDNDFLADHNGLLHAIDLMKHSQRSTGSLSLPASLPATGLGSKAFNKRSRNGS